MNQNNVQNTIESMVNITKVPLDSLLEYELDEQTSWVKDLFDELEEETDREDEDYTKGNLNVTFTLKRRNEKPFGDHLLMKGHIEATYYSHCVRCLVLTKQHISEDFNCSFLHKHMQTMPEYEEADDIFTEGEEFDLNFHDKGKIDIAEAVHEQLFINVDAFPLHDINCKGLCPETGRNLNEN